MGVNLIFKIAAVGILVSVICQILMLFWMVPYIYELFETIKNLFAL